VIVSATLLVQLGVVLSRTRHHPYRMAGGGLDPGNLLANLSIHHVATPILGSEAAQAIAAQAGWIGDSLLLAVFVGVAGIALWSGRDTAGRPDREALLFLGAFLVLSVSTSALAILGRAGGRYAVLSGYALLFFLLTSDRRSRHRWVSGVGGLLLCGAFVVGARSYRDSELLRCDGARWAEAVASWRKEPERARMFHRPASRELSICPERWTVELAHPHEDEAP